MALLHVTRRQARNPMRWNIACDIVINAMIVDAGLKLPAGAIFDDELNVPDESQKAIEKSSRQKGFKLLSNYICSWNWQSGTLMDEFAILS